MRKSNEPFTKTVYRYDRIYRVPTSMINVVKVGDTVKRVGDALVVTTKGQKLSIGGSYTQFSHWGEQ